MAKFSAKAISAGLIIAALSAISFSATPAAAFGHGHGGFGPGLGHGHWGHHGWGFGWPWFAGGYYGGCYLKRFVDEDGDIVVRKVCY